MKKPPKTEDDLRREVKKLPLWMKKIVDAALDERDRAIAKLNAETACQKKTPFFAEDYEFGAKGHTVRRRYFDEDREIVVVHNGIRLEVNVGSNNMRDGKGIVVTFSADQDGIGREGVCLCPRSHHQVEFRKPEDVR